VLRRLQAFRKRSRGVALITVLWLVALLTMLATSVVTLSLSERRLATRNMEAARLDAIADSAIRLTLLKLIAPKPRSDLPRPGQVIPVEVLNSTVEVFVERELGRVDLNTADEELIFAMFAANGWTEEKATSLSARIADWKDSDDTPHASGGAERSQYVEAQLAHTPRNGQFESVEELRQVLGAANVSEGFLQAFTVYTHTRSPVDFSAAPAARKALEFADKRQLGGHKWLTPAAENASNDEQQQQSLIGEVVRVRACPQAKSTRCRVVIARLTGSRDQPLQIFVWK
jgi:general secretion pathway protein K